MSKCAEYQIIKLIINNVEVTLTKSLANEFNYNFIAIVNYCTKINSTHNLNNNKISLYVTPTTANEITQI